MQFSDQIKIVSNSGYIQPVSGKGSEELGRILRVVREVSPYRCFGIDGNGHPFSTLTNSFGYKIECMSAGEDCVVMNHRDSTLSFRGDNGSESWIYFSSASMELIDRTINWIVDMTAGLVSDHE